MSVFCFKTIIREDDVETVISFDLANCILVQDLWDRFYVYLSGFDIPVEIPKEAKELFLEAWKKFKGCDMQSLWKEPVGTAVYTKQSRSPASHAAVDEISEFDHHASEFMKNLKDLEDRINGVEKTFDLKGK